MSQNNGYCDDACNTAKYNFDNGDCCGNINSKWDQYCEKCECLQETTTGSGICPNGICCVGEGKFQDSLTWVQFYIDDWIKMDEKTLEKNLEFIEVSKDMTPDCFEYLTAQVEEGRAANAANN